MGRGRERDIAWCVIVLCAAVCGEGGRKRERDRERDRAWCVIVLCAAVCGEGEI
jgi:hypothetical protein